MARVRLREFQEYLSKRLTGAARGEHSSALLGVQSGGEQWLLDLSDAGEIIPLLPLAPVPLTHSWFAGMANIRGNLYSVVDFSAFRGGEATTRTQQTRLVLIGARHGVNSAILVNRMLGLKPLSAFTESSNGNSGEDSWAGDLLTDGAGQTWHRLDVPKLLIDQKFMQIGV